MSRTTSQNSRFALVASFVLVAAVLPAGCGVNVHSSSVRGIGYVHVDAVVKAHPLYPQLSQLDDAIAAINLSAAAPRVPLSASQIAAQTGILNRELRAAQDRANRILAQKQAEYAGRERQAVAQALKAAGVSGSAVAALEMNATSAAQTHQAVAAANQDFQAYQQSVVSAGNAATNAVARQLQTQESQKLRAKEISPVELTQAYLDRIAEIARTSDVSPIEFAERQQFLLTNPGLGGRLQVDVLGQLFGTRQDERKQEDQSTSHFADSTELALKLVERGRST